MTTDRILSAAVATLVLAAGVAQAQEFPKPGPEHERLKRMAGEWDAVVKFKLQPDQAPEESKGEYTAKLDWGGFFLVGDFKGNIGGLPFQGHGVTGYDPFKKKYTGIWIDSMSPAIFNVEGAFDESGKVFNENMEGPGPGGKPMKFRSVTEMGDPDHMNFKIYTPGADGKETLMMEIAYTRRK